MSFSVQIEPSGHSFTAESKETLLDAALQNDIGLPYGCRNGMCGSCMCKLQEGEVDYPEGKPAPLENEADDAVLTCKAIPKSDLVIFSAEVEKAEEIEIINMPCKVHSVEHLAHDVIRLLLKQPDGQRLQFMAGQYLDIILEDGKHRAFSIANAPHNDELIELHIRYVPGGKYTDFVFHGLKEKDILRIQAPMGSFTLQEQSDRPMIFVAGGTGFAPIKGIIEHAMHIGNIRPIHIYWGVRSERDLYMSELPQKWADEHSNISYTPVLSEPDEGWNGRTGFVHEAVIEDNNYMGGFDVYMAGPPIMVKSGRDAFANAGLSQDRMFYDSFEYAAASENESD